jgi:hypothetical protein
MRRLLSVFPCFLYILCLLCSAQSTAAAPPGQMAPDFSLPATDGKPVKLSDMRGKWVVLEWVNPGCPYVQKHYVSKNMQALQKESGGRGVVWLAVNSTNPSHHDYLKPAKMGEWMKAQGGAPRATLMDEFGDAGRAYSARTTPQMIVVSPEGRVVYNGAIDDRRSVSPEDIKGARNHVRAALDESLAGKPVSVASTTPYGCSVKY